MSLIIDVEGGAWSAIPDLEQLARRVIAAGLAARGLKFEDREINLLFTGDAAMAEINRQWRGKDTPTNVLSFPAEDMPVPPGEVPPLGDIVLAFETVNREAEEQGKRLPHHAAHLMIHGLLHLLDFDHEGDDEAESMERLEIEILKGLGISDPYERARQ